MGLGNAVLAEQTAAEKLKRIEVDHETRTFEVCNPLKPLLLTLNLRPKEETLVHLQRAALCGGPGQGAVREAALRRWC